MATVISAILAWFGIDADLSWMYDGVTIMEVVTFVFMIVSSFFFGKEYAEKKAQ